MTDILKIARQVQKEGGNDSEKSLSLASAEVLEPRSFRNSYWSVSDGIGKGVGGGQLPFSKPSAASALFASSSVGNHDTGTPANTSTAMSSSTDVEAAVGMPSLSLPDLSPHCSIDEEQRIVKKRDPRKIPMSVAAWLGIACSFEERKHFFSAYRRSTKQVPKEKHGATFVICVQPYG